jgi:hypothetical protein
MYDIVENPIPRSGLFATKSLTEIQEYIEAMPTEARATAYLIMQFTLNACNKLVEDKILSKEIFAQ